MKRLVLILMLCHLACVPAVATFEVDDPVQQIEDLRTADATGKTNSHADLIALDKRDYLKLIVGNYVHGFSEFDTTIWTSDELVRLASTITRMNKISAGQSSLLNDSGSSCR